MDMPDDRLVTATRVDEDAQYEAGLRPRVLDDYIGQDRVRENLQVSIAAARQRGEALDHVLLYGPPGLGNTTLPYFLTTHLRTPVRTTAGPVLEKPGDLAAILTNLGERDVLFIDEIHRMAPTIEEILYPALEDYELDIVIGQGPSARSVKVPLQKFTLIGATTRAGLLTSALRARFGVVPRLGVYLPADLEEIARGAGRFLDGPIVGGGTAVARLSAECESDAARRPRFRPGTRRRPDYDERGGGRAQAARGGRARVRRGRPQAAPDDHRQVRRRSGRGQQHRRGDQRR